MLITLVTILHLLVCVFLIFIVLIQSSKGAEMGAVFGGSNQTIFGSRGAATFMNKITTISAVVFMLTSLSLAVLQGGSITPIAEPVRESPAESFPGTTSIPFQEETAPGEQGPFQ